MKRVHCWLAICLFSSLAALGQSTVTIGTPPFGSFAGGPDILNLSNLNAHWDFPIVSKAGRGTPFHFEVPYDSSVWTQSTSSGTTSWTPANQSTLAFGWPTLAANSQGAPGGFSYTTTVNNYSIPCYVQGPNPQYIEVNVTMYTNWQFIDQNSTIHPFPSVATSIVSPSCPVANFPPPSNSGNSPDGYSISITNGNQATAFSKAGLTVTPGYGSDCGGGSYTETDANGNEISELCGVFTDTLGQTALTITGGTIIPPVVFETTNPSGGTSEAQLIYTSQTIRTNFGCSGVSEYGPYASNLPSQLLLADGRSYYFTYEATPGYSGDTTGRLLSVTLPSGGSVTYAYSGSNDDVNCADGSTVTLGRTVSDGTTPETTTYARTFPASGEEVTTVTPPSYQSSVNQTAITFWGNAATAYEVARQLYYGSQSSGNIQETVLTCYQSSVSKCATTVGTNGATAYADNYNGTSSLANIFTWTQYPNSTGFTSGTQSSYDNIENQTQHVVYDFASGGQPSSTALQTVNTTFAKFASGPPSGTESAYPSEVTLLASGNVQVADTKYTYNGTSTTATSGTPQHTTTGISPMNLTQMQQWVSGSTYLTSNNTYYDTGQISTAADVNGHGLTTYTYGSSSCGNAFPTSINAVTGGSVVTTLYSSATWNCTGGVQLTSQDVNFNTTTYGYGSDPFWRPTSVTGPTGSVVDYTYPTTSSNTSSSAMNFNGTSSTNTSLATYDGLGRTIVQQTQQSPGSSNYDTVAIAYDSIGRVTSQTLPYTGTAGQHTTSNPGTTTVYDALGRPTNVTDSGGGYTTYTYKFNDVLVTVWPQVTSPSSENLKKRSFEYNGAGWLSSVCEVITSTSPTGGSCAQDTSYTGYLTKYTYDGAGRLSAVSQNSQSGSTGIQTRSLTYDGLGRRLSESIPEWSAGTGANGTSTYTYDTESGSCNTRYTGDLIKTVDNLGNTTCMTYDYLHRPLSSKVVSGTYASVTPYTFAVYDAATYSGTAMQNVMGAVAEAYTCTGTCSTKLTDVYASASAVTTGSMTGGVLRQMWESTPHSGGYFQTQDTYYPNGSLGAISALLGTASIGIPNLTFGVDGEGRPYSATETAHNLVTAATYNAASMPTGVTFGNSATGSGNDSDTFGYDPNTFRPTTITNSIYPTGTSYTVASTLTWNPNGSLQKFQFTDGSPTPLNQTCSYQADDLSRIASASCVNGSTTYLSQAFSYDPFGNITKAGNLSYSASYKTATNQVYSGITPSPTYDANGNQKNLTATSGSVAWNALNQPITFNGTITATYDALGRMVETASGTTYKQFVFRPSGAMLAVYSSSTSSLVKGTVPLPGGETAIYNASGLSYIRHTDWLGSSRFSTTWGHTVYSKDSYAPFGETYNEAGTADRSFTGQDQNVITGSGGTGVYDFLYRKHDPSAGRWLSPDPSGWAAVNLINPQSLNRYAYVLNNPLTNADPFGLSCVTSDDGDVGDDGDGEGCDQGGIGADGSDLDPYYYVFNYDSSGNIDTTSDSQSGVISTQGPAPINGSCIALTPAGKAVVAGLVAVAQFTNRTVGFGLGGSAGAGAAFFGLNLSGSGQIVASPDGTSGLALTYITPTIQGMFSVASAGFGGVAGAQLSASTVGTVTDLEGPGLNAGVTAADGLGAGFDTTFGVANGEITQQINLTLGGGWGGNGHGAAVTHTKVIPLC